VLRGGVWFYHACVSTLDQLCTPPNIASSPSFTSLTPPPHPISCFFFIHTRAHRQPQDVEKELANIDEQLKPLRERFSRERAGADEIRALHTRREELLVKAQAARRAGDIQTAADLEYGAIPEINAKMKRLEADAEEKRQAGGGADHMVEETVDEKVRLSAFFFVCLPCFFCVVLHELFLHACSCAHFLFRVCVHSPRRSTPARATLPLDDCIVSSALSTHHKHTFICLRSTLRACACRSSKRWWPSGQAFPSLVSPQGRKKNFSS
jgi:hypothetical protein